MFLTYKEQLEDPRWIAKRHEVKEYYGFKCQKCGKTNVPLEAHHPVYRPGRMAWEYAVTELMCLCHECHYAEHHKDEIAFQEYVKRMDYEYICELRKTRQWLIAIPVDIDVVYIKNKTLGIRDAVGGMLVKSKKNALAQLDQRKNHYLLIGDIPSNKYIETVCGVPVKIDSMQCIYAVNDRVYHGEFHFTYELIDKLHKFLEEDDTNYEIISRLCDEYGYIKRWGEDENKLFRSCIVQTDAELKLIMTSEELHSKPFPSCFCMNI